MNNYGNKNKNRGSALTWLLGTLAVLGGVIAYAVISSLISRLLIGERFGSDVACALLPLSIAGLTVAFVLYEAIFIVRLVKFNKDEDKARAKRVARIVTAACISLSFIFAIFSANTFTCLREESISKVCFVETKRYEWSTRCDVQRYSLSCDGNGRLSYIITMKDGEKIELWKNSVNSCSDAFTEKYGDLYKYAAHLSNEFDSSEFIIEKTVTGIDNMEKHYKESNPELWVVLQDIINDDDTDE